MDVFLIVSREYVAHFALMEVKVNGTRLRTSLCVPVTSFAVQPRKWFWPSFYCSGFTTTRSIPNRNKHHLLEECSEERRSVSIM